MGRERKGKTAKLCTNLQHLFESSRYARVYRSTYPRNAMPGSVSGITRTVTNVVDEAGTCHSRRTSTGREPTMFTVEPFVDKSRVAGITFRSSKTFCCMLRRQGGIYIVGKDYATTHWK